MIFLGSSELFPSIGEQPHRRWTSGFSGKRLEGLRLGQAKQELVDVFGLNTVVPYS